MTAFDLVALLLVIVSALVGFARGAVREVVSLVAFAAAAVAALLALPFTAPVLRHLFHTGWMAAAAAVVVVFVLVYVLLRVFGGQLSGFLRTARLGGADKALGAGVGLVRALVVLGGFFLVYDKAMPRDLSPRWITHAATWPVARASGHALAVIAPSGGRLSSGVGRLVGANVKAGFAGGPDDAAHRNDDAEGAQLGGDAQNPADGDAATRQDRDHAGSSPDSSDKSRGLQVLVTDGRPAAHHHARHGDGESSR